MEKIFALTPRDRRSAVFFWLGVGVFPVFWSWFTMGKKFPRWQRHLALGWMLAVVATWIITWPQMAERYYQLPLKLPSVMSTLTVALWIWLALRLIPLGQLVLLFIVSIDIIAILSSLCVPTYHRLTAAGCSLGMLLMPLFPALLHLVVEPTRRGWARLARIPPSIRQFWIFFAMIPAFFVWFTIHRCFTRRERVIAWLWTVIHTTAFLLVLPQAVYLSPLAAFMAVVALRSRLSGRSGPHSDDHS